MNSNNTILITGASSGIGLHIGLLAEQQGYDVIWASRNATKSVLHKIGQNSIKIDLDVSSEGSVIDAMDIIKAKYGSIFALINCAGYVLPESMLSTSLENWKKTISTNLTGTFLCCKYATPLLINNNKGNIINISSTAGLTSRPGWSAYAASKSGVISFSDAIAEELQSYNIRVFVICPGRTATPLRTILAPTENPTTIMQPESVAKIALFCLSDEAAVIEGQPIIVRDRF